MDSTDKENSLSILKRKGTEMAERVESALKSYTVVLVSSANAVWA